MRKLNQFQPDTGWGKVPTSLSASEAAADPAASETATQATQTQNEQSRQAQAVNAVPPPPLMAPIAGTNGFITPPWAMWTTQVYQRSGGSVSTSNDDLALIGFSAVGSGGYTEQAITDLADELAIRVHRPSNDAAFQTAIDDLYGLAFSGYGGGSSQVSGFADPSASIGLTAVNGTSTDAMRADSAPALSQAIVPTWTGVHTFSAVPVFNAGFTAKASSVITLSSTGTVSFSVTNTNAGASAISRIITRNDSSIEGCWTTYSSGSTTTLFGNAMANGVGITAAGTGLANMTIGPTVGSVPLYFGSGSLLLLAITNSSTLASTVYHFYGTLDATAVGTAGAVFDCGVSVAKQLWVGTTSNLKAITTKAVANKTGSYTITSSDYLIRYTSTGGHTFTLPAATGTGQIFIIKHAGSGTLTVARAGSDTIDGGTSLTLSAYQSVTLCDSASATWDIL